MKSFIGIIGGAVAGYTFAKMQSPSEKLDEDKKKLTNPQVISPKYKRALIQGYSRAFTLVIYEDFKQKTLRRNTEEIFLTLLNELIKTGVTKEDIEMGFAKINKVKLSDEILRSKEKGFIDSEGYKNFVKIINGNPISF